MEILIVLLAIASVAAALITFFSLWEKLQYFRKNFTPTESGYELITLPYRAMKKFFWIYTVTLIIGSICVYEIFKQYMLH